MTDTGIPTLLTKLGGEVMRVRIPKEQPRITLGTATLAPGVYQYRVLSAEAELGVGKLSIMR